MSNLNPVNQTRTQRIHRGFHRLGAVLGGTILLLTVLTSAVGGLGATKFTEAVSVAAAAAAAIYALCRAVGWVLAGFLGD